VLSQEGQRDKPSRRLRAQRRRSLPVQRERGAVASHASTSGMSSSGKKRVRFAEPEVVAGFEGERESGSESESERESCARGASVAAAADAPSREPAQLSQKRWQQQQQQQQPQQQQQQQQVSARVGASLELVQRVCGLLRGGDLLRARQACRLWREACDRVGLGACVVVPTGPALRLLAPFARAHAWSITRLDLSRLNSAQAAQCGALIAQCARLDTVKVVTPAQGVWGAVCSARAGLAGVEVLDASQLGAKDVAQAPAWELRALALWRAPALRVFKRLLTASLARLCLSDAPQVDDTLVVTLTRLGPPLEELVLRNTAPLAPSLLAGLLAVANESLRVLDLSGSVPLRAALNPGCHMSRLEVVISEGNGAELDGLLRCVARLEVLSLSRSTTIGDEHFAAAPSWPALRVVRLSGTRVTERSVDALEALPRLQFLAVDSCRNVPRATRLKWGNINHTQSLAAIAPDLRFPGLRLDLAED
jgi:hypothetical protein